MSNLILTLSIANNSALVFLSDFAQKLLASFFTIFGHLNNSPNRTFNMSSLNKTVLGHLHHAVNNCDSLLKRIIP